MRAYVEFAVKKFQNKMAYRMDCFFGIFNTMMMFLVSYSIYKAIYAGSTEIDGISLSMTATNFILALGLSNAYVTDSWFIEHKRDNGTIACELLRPVEFKFRMLWENIGEVAFKLLFQFLPAFVIAAIFTPIMVPSSIGELALCILSCVLGFLILWELDFMAQMSCFWIYSSFGVNIIKNVLVQVLAGTMLPLWFMPDMVMRIIEFTPFDSIYFAPVQFYLGQLQGMDMVIPFVKQLIWIVLLYFFCELIWRKARKKLVIQGG